jgi:hypothetical protein
MSYDSIVGGFNKIARAYAIRFLDMADLSASVSATTAASDGYSKHGYFRYRSSIRAGGHTPA